MNKAIDPLAAFGGVSPSDEGESKFILPLEKGETPPKAARGSVVLFRFVELRILRHIRVALKLNPVPVRIRHRRYPHPVPHERPPRLYPACFNLAIDRQC